MEGGIDLGHRDDLPDHLWLHLTMHRAVGLTNYCRTISGNGLSGYLANRLNGLGLGLGVRYSPLV